MQKFENNGIFNLAQSEDLPHSSGIKTESITDKRSITKSEDLPHSSGIKTN